MYDITARAQVAQTDLLFGGIQHGLLEYSLTNAVVHRNAIHGDILISDLDIQDVLCRIRIYINSGIEAIHPFDSRQQININRERGIMVQATIE
ncbi:hypothetical protein D3C80_1640650 [compost metagenome]